ncbi:MAG TPA: PAS-domain containing protein [Microvirga sp.]|nr:PAS-domain containing protein [Microvirga sp.]
MSLSPDRHQSSDHATLQVAEQRLRQALRAGCIAAWEWDLATNHVVWSDNAEHLLGLRSGHTSEFEERVHPEDRQRHQAALKATTQAGEPYDIELRFVKPDGTTIWIHDKAELQIDPQGQRFLIGITADITRRKTAELEAQEKTALLEATLENMDQGILMVDQTHRIALFNRRVANLLDLPPALLATRPDFEAVRQYQAQRGEFDYTPDPDMERILREGVAAGSLARERVRPNGAALEIRTVPLAGGGVVRTFTDVTARKRAEAEASEALSLLRTTLEHMDQGLIMVDTEETIRLYNRRALELLDLPESLMYGPQSFDAVKRYQREKGEFIRSDAQQRQWLDTGDFLHQKARYIRERPNGMVLEVCSIPLPGGGAVRTFTDITAQKRAEQALRLSEERARDFANIASDWFWETDAEFRYTSLMGAAQILLTDAAIGKTLWDAVGGDSADPAWRRLISSLSAGKPFRDFEFELKTPRGRSVWFSSSGQPILDPDGNLTGYRGVSTNITHRKATEAERESLQAQLREAQKLQIIGQLTGGIAHDFNNLLAVILGNAELITENPTDPALAYALADQIMVAAERGSDLTQKLLAFGRRQSLKPERLKLKQVVEAMVPLLHRTIGAHIELQIHLNDSDLAALTDRTLLESAILNLAVNARDAMPQGGALTIRTGERFAGPAEGALPMGHPVVYVIVADTGMGIPPDVLSRVFEPFFTTKEVGKGSGLGLPMVYGFAQQTGGHVSIESQVGVGTTVTIVLPAIAAADRRTEKTEDAPEMVAHGERILVVEDEPGVLRFVTSQLVSLGYEVEAVSTGPDALEVLARRQEFDLLFTDVMLPKGMSGVELARRARELVPDLKVLLTSGYSEDVFEHHGRPDANTLLLRKPYRRRELAETLRRVLDEG